MEAAPAVGWKWIETGFNYILMDIEFPEGQSEIGSAISESSTYRDEGIAIKTVDGGDTWTRLTRAGILPLEAMFSSKSWRPADVSAEGYGGFKVYPEHQAGMS